MLYRASLRKGLQRPKNSNLKYQVQGNRKCFTLFHVVSSHSLSWQLFYPSVWTGIVIFCLLGAATLPRCSWPALILKSVSLSKQEKTDRKWEHRDGEVLAFGPTNQ